MAKRGRPSSRNARVEFVLLGRIAQGWSLRRICKRKYMPHEVTILRWLSQDHEFRIRYHEAMDVRAHHMFEQMEEIADSVYPDTAMVAKARLQVDVRRWNLSRMNPKRYGDRVEVEQTGKVDVTKIKIIELVPAAEPETKHVMDLDLIPFEGKHQ